jgi:phospholipid transport system substrate-binding protein
LVQAAELSDIHARFDFLRVVVTSTHDLDFIGQLTVRRQWREWTQEQRAAFLAAFRSLSIMNYAARFANVSATTFDILGPQSAGNGRIEVKTTLARADGTSVPLDFVLQAADGSWRIANVIADGVSDLALKRAEYQTMLNESDVDGLVSELEAQTRALAQAGGE